MGEGTARRLLLPFGRTALKKFDTVSDMVDFRTGMSGEGAFKSDKCYNEDGGWMMLQLGGRPTALYKGNISGTGGCSRACAVCHPRVKMDIDSSLGSGF